MKSFYWDAGKVGKRKLLTCKFWRWVGLCWEVWSREPWGRAEQWSPRAELPYIKIKYRTALDFVTPFSWNQCCGSITFWYGSGSGDPRLWLMDPDPAIFVVDLQDANKKLIFFLSKFSPFWRSIYIIFKDKQSKRSHKTVGIKVLLTIFVWW